MAEIDPKKKKQDIASGTDLPEGTKIEPTDIEVKSDEVIGIEDKLPDAPTPIDAPDPIETVDQKMPDQFDVAKVDATKTGDVGKAEVARGEVSEGAIVEAAQGTVSPESMAEAVTEELDPRATTQYQIAELFKGLEAGSPPPAWAAPGVRKAAALMASRGLGSSSMAAGAAVQAMMESGIPIAAQDAQKYANIQLQNLTNSQQATLQNAATVAAMDLANLNNRQQAAVANAKAFLSIDLQNLTNEQQANTVTFQQKVAAMLSDTAAENAAKQFNAKTENDIQTFFTELGVSIEATNISRDLSVKQFNQNQSLALKQFNEQMKQMDAQFKANMRLEIDQSNAVWRRNVNTQNTAAQNEANRQNATNLLTITQQALNDLWQEYRDKAAWVIKISESAKDRAHNAAMQSASIKANADLYDEQMEDFLYLEAIDNLWPA